MQAREQAGVLEAAAAGGRGVEIVRARDPEETAFAPIAKRGGRTSGEYPAIR